LERASPAPSGWGARRGVPRGPPTKNLVSLLLQLKDSIKVIVSNFLFKLAHHCKNRMSLHVHHLFYYRLPHARYTAKMYSVMRRCLSPTTFAFMYSTCLII